MESFNKYIDVNSKNWLESALLDLKKDGVIVLRGIERKANLEKINEKVDYILKNPSVLGSIGYFQKDHNKKIYDGFLLGKEVVDFVANKSVIKLIESYLEDEIILNEMMLKNDLGNGTQYFPYHRHTGRDVEGPKDKAFGCGAILYLHDTEIGAFCYALKSHTLEIEENPESNLSRHEKKEEIKKNLRRINGNMGDLVIFDERGFHGPEQPVKTPRTVILYGFQSKLLTSNKSRTGIPVVISDLVNLDLHQLNSIGVGGGTRSEYENYHARKSVIHSKKYKLLSCLITSSSRLYSSYIKLKNKIKL